MDRSKLYTEKDVNEPVRIVSYNAFIEAEYEGATDLELFLSVGIVGDLDHMGEIMDDTSRITLQSVTDGDGSAFWNVSGLVPGTFLAVQKESGAVSDVKIRVLTARE